jgi:hypothetical protein
MNNFNFLSNKKGSELWRKESVQITIADQSGREIYRNPKFTDTYFDVRQFSNGLYVLSVTNSIGVIRHVKFVVAR